MHNTHYIIVKAEDEESARELAEQTASRYCNNDDLWYTIENIVNLNEPTVSQQEYLLKEVENLNYHISQEQFDKLVAENEELTSKACLEKRECFWMLAENYTKMYELAGQLKYGNLPITLENLKDVSDFYGFRFANYGITNIEVWDEDDVLNTYFIELDVHS